MQGRFSLAARYHSNVAEIYETELQEYDHAISNYEQAADFHRGEDSVRLEHILSDMLSVRFECAIFL